MSATSKLQPHFDSYFDEMRKAKNVSGYTLQDLSELSGVPYNNVCDVNSGRAKQPLLFYEAAKCEVLGLSLDSLCGLSAPEDPDAAEHRHELELDNVRQAGDVKRLEEVNAMLKAQLASRRPVIYALIAVCALLLVCLISYMVWDAQLATAGLFQSAGSGALAVVLGLIVVAAVCVMVYALRMLRK